MRIEVRRLLDPSLNVAAVESLVIDLVWLGEIELRPEFAVEIGQPRLCAIGRDTEEVADHGRRGNQCHDRRRIGRDGEIEHGLIAMRNLGTAPDWAVTRMIRVRASVDHVIERVAVGRPVQGRAIASTGAALSPKTALAHVVVVIGGEVARLRVGCEVHHPEIGLRVRLPDADDPMKSDAVAIRADGEVSDAHGNRGQLSGLRRRSRARNKYRSSGVS